MLLPFEKHFKRHLKWNQTYVFGYWVSNIDFKQNDYIILNVTWFILEYIHVKLY